MTAKNAAAGESTVTLDVALLGRAYKFSCRESERAELEDAAAYLDAQMKGIRAAGKVAAVDRIAVMAALNIAHELLRARQRPVADDGPRALSTVVPAIDDAAARRRIHDMQSAIDQVLADDQVSS